MHPGWTRTKIVGKPADAFDPGPAAPPFGLIFLHDESGTPPGSLLSELSRHKLRCVCPVAPHSWWVDRVCSAFDPALTAERHVLDNVLPWVRENWKPAPRGVALAGVGMGGQGAVRLGLRHPAAFPIVGSIAGAFDFHERHGRGTPLDDMYPSREHARQDTAVLHVHGHDWPPHVWFACPPGHEHWRGNDRLREKLSAIGVPHSADLDTDAPPERLVPPMLAFVAAALQRESRKLV